MSRMKPKRATLGLSTYAVHFYIILVWGIPF